MLCPNTPALSQLNVESTTTALETLKEKRKKKKKRMFVPERKELEQAKTNGSPCPLVMFCKNGDKFLLTPSSSRKHADNMSHYSLLERATTNNLRTPYKALSANESFSLPSLDSSPTTSYAQQRRRGSARDAFSGSLKEMGDFELLEVLGKGFFGVVYKVRDKYADTQSEPIVMKVPIMRDQDNLPPQSAKKIANKEDYMLTALRHPNILKSKGLCVQRTNSHWQLNLLVEFCDGGSLQQWILSQRPLTWLCIARIVLDICRGMDYVHERGFLHRDLTSMNVLLKSQPNCLFHKAVIADFGLSTKIPKFPSVLQQVGTANWMAPEVLKEQFYNEKADLFSFGVILSQMLARIDADHDAGLYRTPEFDIDFVKFTQQMCPLDTPKALLKSANRCTMLDASLRPPFSELVSLFASTVIPELECKLSPEVKRPFPVYAAAVPSNLVPSSPRPLQP